MSTDEQTDELEIAEADEAAEQAAEAVEADEAREADRSPFGAAKSPIREARRQRAAQVEPEVKAPSVARFHDERSLAPTTVKSRPAPKVRAHEDHRFEITDLTS